MKTLLLLILYIISSTLSFYCNNHAPCALGVVSDVRFRSIRNFYAKKGKKAKRDGGNGGGGGGVVKKDVDIIKIEDEYCDMWKMSGVVDALQKGDVGVLPTDTCYSFVARIDDAKAVDRLLRLKGGSGHKKPLSILCKDLSQASIYTEQFGSQRIFKLLKTSLPGAFTFILPASKELPKVVMSEKIHPRRWRRKEIGIRIPNDPICAAILQDMQVPLLCGSVPGHPEDWMNLDLSILTSSSHDTDIHENRDDLDLSYESITDEFPWTRNVDFIVEAGYRGTAGQGLSTVVDLTSGEVVIIRQGVGKLP
jgi:tRNA threonylcarbamoyl adenosine modification protein (Sua5/YciO/YrdC/YwlC family)